MTICKNPAIVLFYNVNTRHTISIDSQSLSTPPA